MAAQAKNKALAAAGATVPQSFEEFEAAIRTVYEGLVKEGSLTPRPDVAAPAVPMDLDAASKAGKVGGHKQMASHCSHDAVLYSSVMS